MKMKKKINKSRIVIIVLLFLLLGSIGCIIYCEKSYSSQYVSYVQRTDEVYNMACGIIHNCENFKDGSTKIITYDFENTYYADLLEKYDIENIAGIGSEFNKAVNLVDNFSRRLTHNSNFVEYTTDMNAMYLLDYSLDKSKHGINCRAKAQIMNESFLALGIYSRKFWINPLSVYDGECHVVNEIWDSEYQKWIMLDTTNNIYWVGEDKIPLSAIEVREKFANQDFITAVMPGENLDNLQKLRNKHMDLILYTSKNMVYFQYFLHYGEGEDDVMYALLPETMEPWDDCLISKEAIWASPME